MADTRFRILMIEDVVRYHSMFEAEINEALSAKVDFVLSGEDGLRRLKAEPHAYDILIVDLNLPGMNGDAVIEAVRKDQQFDNLIIIVLTGSTSPNLESRLLGLGANEFIEKGCAPELFIARLRAQARTKLALDKLTQVALDRDMFAAGVLHDLRNIETSLLTGFDLMEMQLKKDPLGNQAQLLEDIGALRAQVKRMDEYASSVINQVRESQKPLKFKPCDVKEVCEWALSIINAGNPEQKLTIEYQSNLKNVSADERLIKPVFLNLLQNAVKYRRPNVAPIVHIGQREESGRLITIVRDNGLGVPEKDLRKIFQPFYRGDNAAAKNDGFGVGLAMVAKVMDTMGGSVWACPCSHDTGTQFCLAFRPT